MSRAIHRLDAELLVLFGALEEKEVVVEVLVVTRDLEELGGEDLRAHDLVVSVLAVQRAHVLDQGVVEHEPLGQVERRALRPLVKLEQLEFVADLAVVALAGRLEPSLRFGQLLRVLERYAVDALEHLVALVAAPIGARQLGELPRADLPGALHVGTATEIGESPVAEDRDVLTRGDVVEPRDLERFARLVEKSLRLVARHDHALEDRVLGDDLRHFGFDAGKVVGRDAHRNVEVVLELLGVVGTADIDLCRWPEALHGVGHHVLGGVADHLASLGITRGDDPQPPARRGQRRPQVDERAADVSGERGLRQASADSSGDVERSAPAGHAHTCAVRQFEFYFTAAHIFRVTSRHIVVGTGGFEPPTPTVSR